MALPKFEDWTPPWGDGELDADKAARLIYNLHADKERLGSQVTTLTTERDEYKGKVDEHETAQLSEVEKLRRELEQAKTAPAVDTIEVARLRVALKEGLTERQARRLAGSTEEELAADAAALKEELGITTGKEGEQEQGSTPPPSRRPRGALQTGLEGGDGEPDVYDPRQLQKQLYGIS